MYSRHFNDITNQKFNNLTALKYVKTVDKSKISIWLFRCDCGKEVELICNNVTRHNAGTTSCGCKRNILPKFQASINKLFYSYKRGAIKRNLEFTLERDQFEKLILSNCFYCNEKPSTEHTHQGATNGNVVYNGIDRADNSLGYIITNCLPCCKFCNYSKHTRSSSEYIEHIKHIVDSFNKGELKWK